MQIKEEKRKEITVYSRIATIELLQFKWIESRTNLHGGPISVMLECNNEGFKKLAHRSLDRNEELLGGNDV